MNHLDVSIGLSFKKVSIVGFIKLLVANKIERLGDMPVFPEKLNIEKPFREHYQRYIIPHIRQLEQKRINALVEFRGRAWIAIILSIIAIFLALYISLNSNFDDFIYRYFHYYISRDKKTISIPIAVIFIFGMAWWCSQSIANYKKSVSPIIYKNIFIFFGDNFFYKEKESTFVKSLNYSEIAPKFRKDYNVEFINGYVKGGYKDVDIELTEVRLGNDYENGKFLTKIIPFQGVFILLDFGKRFSGNTIVKQGVGLVKNFALDFFGKFDNIKLKNVNLENKFEVYTNDEEEANKLVTASFIKRLMALSEIFNGAKLQCSFYEGKLLLMIPSKDSIFDRYSVFKPATFIEDSKTILAVMNEVFQMIDWFKTSN